MQYKTVALGGTFDNFHKGHKAFLAFAFSKGKRVIIGLTTDAFVKQNKSTKQIASFEKRKESLETYLYQHNLQHRAMILPIDDIYGPAISNDLAIDALIVTTDTKYGAEAINKERRKRKLFELPVEETELIREGELVISSENIRKGLINAQGEAYINREWFEKDHKLPQDIRTNLHKPFGELLTDGIETLQKIAGDKLVSVGDITAERFLALGMRPHIAVVDFTVEREKKFSSFSDIGFIGTEEVMTIHNPPATLTAETWNTVKRLVDQLQERQKYILYVKGEEDLVALPLFILLPIGFSVVYGQPHEGLVNVLVTEEVKNKAKKILDSFVPVDY